MKPSIDQIILTPVLERYFNNDGQRVSHQIEIRDRVSTMGKMQLIIYSNDHNPPHFHVKSNDRKVDAKFKIENCEYISGKIDSKDLKKVVNFYNDPKVKSRMVSIWNKRVS